LTTLGSMVTKMPTIPAYLAVFGGDPAAWDRLQPQLSCIMESSVQGSHHTNPPFSLKWLAWAALGMLHSIFAHEQTLDMLAVP
jgi:hypothetical protein